MWTGLIPCTAAPDRLSRGCPPRSPTDTPWPRSPWRSSERWSRAPSASGGPIHAINQCIGIFKIFRNRSSFELRQAGRLTWIDECPFLRVALEVGFGEDGDAGGPVPALLHFSHHIGAAWNRRLKMGIKISSSQHPGFLPNYSYNAGKHHTAYLISETR